MKPKSLKCGKCKKEITEGIEDLRDIKDGLAEIVDSLGMCCTSSETIMGYLVINGEKAQITLNAETDEGEWISD